MTIKVLAVDDSRTMRDMISMALEDQGFAVSTAEDGVEGLKALEEHAPDVIITDINMPRLDGFGCIDAVRSREASRVTPILVLTTENSDELKVRARTSGATGWIIKPFDQEKLIRVLHSVAG